MKQNAHKSDRAFRNLKDLMWDYKNDYSSSTNGHSEEAEMLQAIIVQASIRHNEVMSAIGNDDEEENKQSLIEAIQNN